MNCPNCESSDIQKRGTRNTKQGEYQRYVCKTCNEWFSESVYSYKKVSPKILIFDIETSLMEAYVFGTHKQRIDYHKIKSDWFIISWSAKWMFDSKTSGDVVTAEEALSRDDKRVVKSLYDLINEADIVIGHNIKEFDLPKINSRLIYHRIKPLNYFQIVDTLEMARKIFRFSSNSLDYLCSYLGLNTGKIETGGLDLWIECQKGNQKALDKMLKYNLNDSVINEDLYVLMRPYMSGHPNLGVYMGEVEEPVCPVCQSLDVEKNGKKYRTNMGEYDSLRCNDCGAILRSRTNNLTKAKRKSMVVK